MTIQRIFRIQSIFKFKKLNLGAFNKKNLLKNRLRNF